MEQFIFILIFAAFNSVIKVLMFWMINFKRALLDSKYNLNVK